MPSDFDTSFGQYVPFDLFGSGARIQGERQDAREARARGDILSLFGQMPTADDLAVNYDQLGTTDEYGNLIGGPSAVSNIGPGDDAQRRTLSALDMLQRRGGYTDADRTQANAMRAQTGQQLGAANQAALQSMYARGMGGSGGELAARLSGAQSAAMANSQNDAAIQQAAMQRLMQSYGMSGALGGAMNAQQLARQQALDAYNQQQLNWRRGRSATNTGLANQSKESRSAANQQAYGNRERGTAMLTNQYQNDANNQQQQYQNQQRSSANLGNFISGVVGGVGGLASALNRRGNDESDG